MATPSVVFMPTTPPASSSSLIIFDTTLRDGEQSPGVSLNAAAKLRIGRALAELGVNICEIGFPACAVDLPTLRSLVGELGHYTPATTHKPMILAVLARCTHSDIDVAWDVVKSAKHPRIHVFYATSDVHLQYKLKKTRAEAIKAIANSVAYARSLCDDIEWSAEDASRTELTFLTEAVVTAINNGATTINIPDTVGSAVPHMFVQFISDLRTRVFNAVGADVFNKITFSTHCHNDLGLATANTISAVYAGCRQVEVTINGIGERAGNTAMEEVVMTAHLHPKLLTTGAPLDHSIKTHLIVPTSQLVAELSGMSVQRNKAIVGANCCLHESGVHADGVLKHRGTYEIFPSELVGWNLTNGGIVLGKHSGRASYKAKMAELGVTFENDAELNAAFGRFQAAVTEMSNQRGETTVTFEQLLATAHDGTARQTTADALPPMDPNLIIELLGDGINDEVVREGRRVLEAVCAVSKRELRFEQHPIGGRAIDLTGNPLPDATLAACKRSAAVLLGAVGDPKYNDPALKVRPEQGLLAIRSELGLYQNLRPVVVYPSLIDASPFKREVIEGTDVMIVRELTGGIYNNEHILTSKDAKDVMYYTVHEVERIVRAAAELARQRKKRLHSLDKANVLACSRLWRSIVTRIMRDEYPDVSYEHMLIDSAAMHLIKRPRDFDVIVTENLFGDILSDEAAALASSLGMMGSASLSSPGKPGLFEPVHGSAPDIAGKGIANPIGTVLAVAMMLRYGLNMPLEAKAVEQAIMDVVESGLVTPDIAKAGVKPASTSAVGQAIANRAAQLTAAARHMSNVSKPNGQRPMNVVEKILLHQSVGLVEPVISPGDWIVCKVARTLASEMTWLGMSETWSSMGSPDLWRKDRFFLAIDHTVDPSNYDKPFQHSLISSAEGFAKSMNIVDYFAPNQSILHTEFYRQRAMPGTVIVGADSHSCSAGCLGAFAAGLGAADVVMPTVTGQTFFQVPETLLINFTNDLPFGMTGKDVMLYVMGKLKRNTVAFERAVEWSGSIKSLSVDSRFALSNMTTEFGGIAGVFPSDEVTASFLAGRKKAANQNKHTAISVERDVDQQRDEGDEGVYNFRADPNASYADRYDIDLSQVTPLIAKYPSPDNVYPLDHPEIDAVIPEVGRSIRHLDGCFIGACTTTEEELILAALVLEVAMDKHGIKPVTNGTRKVTPGSSIMVTKLERLGLLDIYRRAGFSVGSPGCSYCIAVAADVAPKGSVWLSSQNRNFRNRMGPGSIGNLASAATVAVSALFMTITDPRPFLKEVDRKRFETCLEREPIPASVPIHEPKPQLATGGTDDVVSAITDATSATAAGNRSYLPSRVSGRVQRFEDNIDTDAIIPAQLMLTRPLSALGQYSFKHVRPEFVSRVNEGATIVVAGIGFGSGSSREEAVSCLRAVGIKAVIAKSYAFIFARNLLCLELLGIVITDERFYDLANEGESVDIDVDNGVVKVGGESFTFSLSPIQRAIYERGGVIEMYRQVGPQLFGQLAAVAKAGSKGDGCGSGCAPSSGKSAPEADLAEPAVVAKPPTKNLQW